jgi:hypothetical protein
VKEQDMRTHRLVVAIVVALGLAGGLLAGPAAAQFGPSRAPGRSTEADRARAVASALYAQFPAFDRNGDGVIHRNEWLAAFDRQDLNRDGVIARRELDAARPVPLPAPTPERREPRVRTFDVDARARWVFSGFTVSTGDTLVVTVEGSVQLSDEGTDTATAAGSRIGRHAPGAPMPGELAGALIGRIGNSAPFGVGDQIQIIAPASGELYLGVNDDVLADNRGRFRVRIALR